MNHSLKTLLTHIFVVLVFIVVALAYFHPVLQGKVLEQSDIIWYRGMSKEQTDFKQRTGEEPYWTNSAFGGMPTYQLGANYPHDYIKKLDHAIRFLPRPADYLFLYLLGFYILLCCLKVDTRLAILGALAFGFSTYLIIIIGVGHNAKAHALAYMPVLLGGILLVFRKKYFWGFVLTALAMALEVSANHYQMTYYFMLLVLLMGAVQLIDAIKKGELKHFGLATGLLVLAVALGVATNATGLLATKEYADWSTRGKSELTLTPEGTPKERTAGLDNEYITQYSYGIQESLDLFVPRLFGGASQESLGKDSKAYDYLTGQGVSQQQALDFANHLPLYWGDQPSVAAPAYLGAVVLFLFVLALFLVKSKAKWWLLAGTLMSLILSWGKNLEVVTNFMISYFPLYNKFRAVSSIQVILELCVPILGILGLAKIFDNSVSKEKKVQAVKMSLYTLLGLCIILFVIKGMFDFVGGSDEIYRRYFGDEVLAMIQRDREAVYVNDTIRSLIFVVLTAIVLWLGAKERLGKNLVALALGILVLVDLGGVDKRYVNEDNFVSKRRMEHPFQATAADQQIMQDTTVYRVYDPSDAGSRTSFFFHSIWGYHAAKPAGMQDLFDYQIQKGNLAVLNMLNVKYVLQQGDKGGPKASINPDANGNAWFVSHLKAVNNADEEMMALDSLDTKTIAVVNTSKVKNIRRFDFVVDSTATIALTAYKPNKLTYRATNKNPGLAVFSEMYYPHGWHAYIDGSPVEHFKVDYVLRALRVPEGDHTIEFRFEPEVVQKGSTISLVSCIFLGLIILGGVAYTQWGNRKRKEA